MDHIPIEEVDTIAEELAPGFCGKELRDLRKDFRELGRETYEFSRTSRQLYELFREASSVRYHRMGLEVKRGNASSSRMREPGEDDV